MYNRFRLLQFLVIGLSLLIRATPTNGQADVPKPEELLDKYQSFLDAFTSITFETEQRVYERGGMFTDWTWVVASKGIFRRQDTAWQFVENSISVGYTREYTTRRARRFEMLFDHNGTYLQLHQRLIRPEMTEAQAITRLQKGDLAFPLEQAALSVTFMAESSKRVHGYALLRIIRPLFGGSDIDGGHTLLELFGLGTTTVKHKEDHGHVFYILECVSKYGTHSLSFDSETEWLPNQLRIEKRNRDLFVDVPLAQVQAGDIIEADSRPNLPLRSYVLDVRFSTGLTDEIPFLTGFVATVVQTYEGGVTWMRRDEVEWSNISFESKPITIATGSEIPDGSKVYIRNAPAIEAVWQDGQIVNVFDERVINTLDDVKFYAEGTRPDTSRSPWVILPFVLALLIVIVLGYRRIRARRLT